MPCLLMDTALHHHVERPNIEHQGLDRRAWRGSWRETALTLRDRVVQNEKRMKREHV